MWASNEETNSNFHRANQLGQRNAPTASAPLGIICLDCVFSLLARLLPWDGHCLGMTVPQVCTVIRFPVKFCYALIPGEPKLSLELTHTVSVTPITAVPASEVARRKAMQRFSVVLRLTLNGREVFVTEPKTLTSDFKLHFGSIFRIRIAQWPESLKVTVVVVVVVQ